MKQAEYKIDNQLFEKIFNEIPDPTALWTKKPDGKIILTMINKASLQLTNNRIKDFIGYSTEEFFSENEVLKETIEYVMETGLNKKIELKIKLRTTGENKWFLSDYVKVDDNNVLNISKDITDRKKAEKNLLHSEERLRNLIENTDDMIFIQDFDGRYLYYNGPKKYGITFENIYRKFPNDFLPPEDSKKILDRVKYVYEKGESIISENNLVWNGQRHWFLDNIYPIRNKKGEIISIGTISRSITQIKLAEFALSESEERYRILVEQSPDGIGIIQDGKIKFINNATLKLLRAENESEIIGRSFSDFLPKNLLEDINKYYKSVNVESKPQTIEIKFKTLTGKIFIVEIISKKIIYKGKEAIQFILRDITKRINNEIILRNLTKKLRLLTTHIHEIVEEEKNKIAREIHDELGQGLTGIKIDLTFMHEMFEREIDREKIKNKLKSMIEIVDSNIKSVRRISTELRPIILDKLGLIAAIEWLVDDIQKRSKIRFNLFLPKEEILFEEKLSIALFRIFQESITNIIRHSFATKVVISMVKIDNHLFLRIKDNGIGIEQEDINNKNSLGIFGMKERVRELRGSIKIIGKKGIGTLVTIEIPMKKNLIKNEKTND